jgi:hypothetical protein
VGIRAPVVSGSEGEGDAGVNADMALPRPTEPYRGAEAFRFVDQKIFLARQEETRALLQKLTIHRGVVLYGESGVGKSSLVNAGLIPAAVERGLGVNRILVQPREGAEIVCERIPLGETGPPFLSPSLVEEQAEHRIELTIAECERRVRAQRQPHLLIFDQFEEIITLFRDANAARRTEIVQMLLRLFYAEGLKVKVLLVFREDYLAKIADLLVLAPEWMAQSSWLRAPDKSVALDIIRAPFDETKLSPAFPKRFSEETMKKLAEQLTAPREPEGLSLTDLQIACLELWRAENPDRLLGEVQATGLIKQYLDHALDKLDADELKDAAIALMSLMVTPGGTRNVISEVDAISRAHTSDPGLSESTLKKALGALETTRLVRREAQHNANYYDIVSEFLAPWILVLRRDREAEALKRRATKQIRTDRYRLAGAVLGIAGILIGITAYTIMNAQKAQLTLRLSESQQAVSQLQQEKGSADLALALLARPQSGKATQRGSGMSGLNIGEMAFAILLVYLLISTLSSVLTEMIAAVLRDKAKNLRSAVDDLFGPSSSDVNFSDAFWNHPLITSLSPASSKYTSYIPADTFSLVMIDLISPGSSGTMESILKQIYEFKDSYLRRTLVVLATHSEDEYEFRQNLASWFIKAMEGAAAYYKKMTQMRLLAIAFALTIALNADTLNMADRLLRAPIAQASALAQLQTAILNYQIARTPPANQNAPPDSQDETRAPSQNQASGPSQNWPLPVSQIAAGITNAGDLGSFIGWRRSERISVWELVKFRSFGWCITALMAFFGASLGYGWARWLKALATRRLRDSTKRVSTPA